MSWLFSQALVAEYSAATSSDGAQSAPLSASPMPQAYCSPDRMTAFSRISRSGMTYAPLTDALGEVLLTWFRAGFPARTSAALEQALESMEIDPGYGDIRPESSARYDPYSRQWKTHHCLWDEVLPWSSVTLPIWGTQLNGFVFPHPTSERPTIAIASGWSGETFPTPSVAMHKGSSRRALTRVDGRTRLRNRLDYWVERDGQRGRLNPEFVEWVMGWPIGWTALKPLAMDKFHEWQRQHSPCSPANAEEAA